MPFPESELKKRFFMGPELGVAAVGLSASLPELQACIGDTVQRSKDWLTDFAMERLPLSVNKNNLLRLEEELSFAQDGLKLLDQKKEALLVHISSLSTKADRVRSGVNEALKTSYSYLRKAILLHGRLACERSASGTTLGEQVQVREKSFMGVSLPRVMIKLPKLSPPYGFHGTGAAMDSVLQAISQGMDIIAELAEIEVGVFRLVSEIKKTLKRINALKNTYIPLYQSTIKYIEENLEEKEREFLFQLKRQKDRRKDQGYDDL